MYKYFKINLSIKKFIFTISTSDIGPMLLTIMSTSITAGCPKRTIQLLYFDDELTLD